RVGGNAQIKAMKKVAGPLKLELAMFRELEAFAKFGSDLDKSTQQQLRRGARLTEILKQDQYCPVGVEKQVILIYAATNGYLDELPLESLKRFEQELFEFIDGAHSDILDTIGVQKEITSDAKTKLDAALAGFVEGFKRTV
ncbi:MAG: F0F1 ATP synthase subunit alpha, partial [Candidatus Kapaibacterium sp.]